MPGHTRLSSRAARVVTALELAAHLGRATQRVATDAILRQRRNFPRAIGDLNAAVVSKFLGRHVDTVSVISGDAGTSSRARLALTGSDVPDTVFVKMPAQTAATRLMGELGRLGHTEVRFYQDLSPQLQGVPACHGSAFDAVTGRYVLLLEDLPAEQCEFPDTLHPLSVDKASLVVNRLAQLHATFFDRLPSSSGTGPLGWVYSPSGDATSLLTGSLLKKSAANLADKTDIPIERGRFVDENYRAVAHVIDRPPHTLMHGDAHPGNVYFRQGEAGLLDWQAVRRGHPGRELAYTLITSMTTADRQANERSLLDEYCSAVSAFGGPKFDRAELWERYCLGALYAYVAPLITAGMGGMQTEMIALEGLRRGVAALDDLDTVALLRKAL